MADGDDVTSRCLEDRGFLFDSPDTEDSGLWLVDDRRTEERARRAVVRDRERATGHFVWRELSLAALVCKASYLLSDACQAQLVGITDDGYDEVAIRQGYGHTDVDVLTLDDVVPIDSCIDAGEVLQRTGYRFDDGRHVRQ